MTPRLRTVLLIDDQEADNYLHRRTIERSGAAESIVVHDSGQGALDYLAAHEAPDLILLDLNMPGMTGWEFLDAHDDPQSVIVIVSTSSNPADHDRARAHPSVAGFCAKPLTAPAFDEILDTHFAG